MKPDAQPAMPDDAGADAMTAAQRQAAARDTYRASLAAGEPLPAAKLAAHFGRSRRWAQERIAEARNQHHPGNGHPAEPATNAATLADDAASTAHDLRDAGWRQRIDNTAVAVVAVVAAVLSYEHQRRLATLAGEGWRAWLMPITVDGLMLTASLSILRRRRTRQPLTIWSLTGLVVGFGVSVAANIAAAPPSLFAQLLAAWPPIALFLAYETLVADLGGHHQGLTSCRQRDHDTGG